MFEYSICTVSDKKLFLKQCEVLEKKLIGIKKLTFLEDVDGSFIQEYEYNGKVISVFNDEYTGSLCIEAEIELTQFFNQSRNN